MIEKSNVVSFRGDQAYAVEFDYKGRSVVCLVVVVYKGGGPICPPELQEDTALSETP